MTLTPTTRASRTRTGPRRAAYPLRPKPFDEVFGRCCFVFEVYLRIRYVCFFADELIPLSAIVSLTILIADVCTLLSNIVDQPLVDTGSVLYGTF